MSFQRSILLALCLLQSAVVEGSLSNYMRGAFSEAAHSIEEFARISVGVPHTDNQNDLQTGMNSSVSRQLQNGDLTLIDHYMSAVNRSYAFPSGLDTDCAVGPEIAVGVSNLQVEAIDKTTGGNIFANSLRYLWLNLYPTNLVPAGTELRSPRVVYDPASSNFVVGATATDKFTTSRIFLALSTGDTPTTATAADWDVVAIDVFDSNLWVKDFTMASDQNSFYITGSMYETTPETLSTEEVDTFVESRVWVFNKGQLRGSAMPAAMPTPVDGTSTANAAVTAVVSLSAGSNSLMLGPYQLAADNFGFGCYLVAHGEDLGTPDTETFVHVVQLQVTGFQVSINEEIVSLGVIDVDTSLPIPEAGQPMADYSPLMTGDRRVSDASYSSGTLHIATTVITEPQAGVLDAAVHWASIDTTSFTVTDSSTFTSETLGDFTSSFYGSLAVGSEVVVGFNAAGPNLFPGMYASVATTPDDIVEIKAGEDSYESLDGLSYSGSYSGMAVDPEDSNCFFAFNTIARFNDPLEAALLFQVWARGAIAIEWGKLCLVQP